MAEEAQWFSSVLQACRKDMQHEFDDLRAEHLKMCGTLRAVLEAYRKDMKQECDNIRTELHSMRELSFRADLNSLLSMQQASRDQMQSEFDSQRAEITNLCTELSNLRAYVSSKNRENSETPETYPPLKQDAGGASESGVNARARADNARSLSRIGKTVEQEAAREYAPRDVSSGFPFLQQESLPNQSSYNFLKDADAEETGEVEAIEGDNIENMSVTFLERLWLLDRIRHKDHTLDRERLTQAYRKILVNAKIEEDMALDVWGATIFAIVKDIPDLVMGEITLENSLRLILILICLYLNLFCQIWLVYFVGWNVMFPNVNRLQIVYGTYHKIAFNASNGHFDQRGFDSLPELIRERVCSNGIATHFFLWICVFLWAVNCFNEFRMVVHRRNSLFRLPHLPKGVAPTHMVHELNLKIGDYMSEFKNKIVCLDTLSIVLVHVLVIIPRSFIALSMLVIGTTFISASKSFEDLILNSLAMSFIFNIDNLLFDCFLPQRLAKNLQHTKIATPPVIAITSQKVIDQAMMKRAYKGSAVLLILVLGFVCAWDYFVTVAILPGYEDDVMVHCSSYLNSRANLTCRPFERDCFPKG